MISDDIGCRVFALEIAGLGVRYYSSISPAGSNLNTEIASGINYVNYEAIIGVGAYQSDIDPSGGIANYSPVSVTLAINPMGTSNDPHVVFGRCGQRATDVTSAQLIENLDYDDAGGTLYIDSDLSALSTPRLLHLGAESLRISTILSDRVVISDRAAANSQRQGHLITLQGSSTPRISTEITVFRGRRAILYAAHQRPDGQISDYVQIINGFIESSPRIDDGSSVSLSIISLTALLDTELSDMGSSSTQLLQDYHYFDGVNCSTVEWACVLTEDDRYSVDTDATLTNTNGTYHIFGPQNIEDTFDLSLIDTTQTFDQHPRYPKLSDRTETSYSYPTAISTDDPVAGTDKITANTTLNEQITIAANIFVYLRPKPEIKRIKISAGLQRWPEVINTELESSGPTAHTGLDGAWVKWSVEDHATLRVQNLCDPAGWNPALRFWFSNAYLMGKNWAYPTRSNPRSGYTSDINKVRFPIDFSGDVELPNDTRFRSATPFVTHGEEGLFIDYPTPKLRKLSTRTHPIRIARAFFQRGERSILTDDGLNLPLTPTSRTYDIQVKYEDRIDGESYTWLKVTHQSVQSPGYRIHLSEDQDFKQLASFGDFAGDQRVEIFTGVRLTRERVGSLMLKLLASGGGGSVNGSYDVFSIGLAIPESMIDVQSFLKYDSSNISYSGDISSEGVSLSDIITPMLQQIGAIIAMKRDQATGLSKITLVPLGAELGALSDETISSGDWLTDRPPTYDIYADIVTQIQVNYDYQGDKFLSKRIFNNQASINEYGGEKSKVSLDLYGLTTDTIGGGGGDVFSYFVPVFSRIFQLLSDPCRLWRGAIGTGKSIYLDVGSYVQCSSDRLKSHSASMGISDEVGMIRSMRQELMGEGCDLEIIHTGIKPVLWAPSAKVTSFTSTKVVCETNQFSVSGTRDTASFEVGDVVDYLPIGDQDNAITGLIISSINNDIITFTAAHGISTAGGTIEPTVYSSATAHNKADAYLSDSSTPPVISSDKAKEYA